MESRRGPSLVVVSVLAVSAMLCAQQSQPAPDKTSKIPSNIQSQQQAPAQPIPANAPRMSKQTRYEIIRDFETQVVYARTPFPMGTKGLQLKNGVTTPSGQELQQALALWGPAVKPGDPAHISFVQIRDNHIHFDINGGAVRRKKWYQHIEVAGNGGSIPLSPTDSTQNPHGTYLDVYFDKYVPEMSAQQLRDLLYPVLDFTAHNKEEAYLDTVPPKVKEAIKAHQVLVGMDSEMVIHSRGKPPKKVREKDGDTEYEEWIYGDPPADVDFVRIVGDEVVRIETMKIGGEKIVRTDKEVIINKAEKDTEAKQQDRPPNAPSLRRPGEDSDNAPKQDDGVNPLPPVAPTGTPTPQGGSGPGGMISGQR